MDCYGIKFEGELFSGHYVSLRNRINDKENDDMSFYNTSNAIEQRLFSVFGKFRRQFFETSFNGKKIMNFNLYIYFFLIKENHSVLKMLQQSKIIV